MLVEYNYCNTIYDQVAMVIGCMRAARAVGSFGILNIASAMHVMARCDIINMMSGSYWQIIVIAVLIFIVLPLIVSRFLSGETGRYHYRSKKYIMTRAEERCFRSLEKKYGAKYYIIPQVHLSALLEHRVKGQNYRGAFSHINGKSVDFVMLDKKSLEVVCAVELDDHTHARADRAERDREVERIFEEAGVRLVRVIV